MADGHEEIDDGRADIEAHNLRQEQTKEIESLGYDQEQYEAIESEFKEFLNDHLKGKDLEKFKLEYTKINKALKTSYEGEKKLIKKCKELIS
jgi:deoxyhypusine synthase